MTDDSTDRAGRVVERVLSLLCLPALALAAPVWMFTMLVVEGRHEALAEGRVWLEAAGDMALGRTP